MKKTITLALLAFASLTAGAQVKYQMEDPGFEKAWANSNEPGHGWNSFASAGGDMKNFASMSPAPVSVDGKSGKGVKILSKEVLIANANGNLTTGRVNMGNWRPADASNYNHTDRSDAAHCMLFGLPDSVSFDAKFKSGGSPNGRGNFILHGDVDYKDPEDASQADYKIASAAILVPASDDWVHYEGAFTYTGKTSEKVYLLGSFTTNPTPGGSAKDELYIDNVNFIYNHSLTSLTYDGTKTEVSEGTTAIDLSSVEYDATKTLTFDKKGVGATISTSYDAATAVLTVTVKGNDYEADNTSKTVYTVQFKKAATETVKEYSNNLLIYFPTASTWFPSEGNTTIKLVTTDNPESHSFLLENFSFSGMALGDIKIDNLSVAEKEDGSSVYTGSQKISLLGGAITADANVTANVKGDDMRAVIDITNATAVGDITVYFAPKVTVSPDATIDASAATGQVNVAFARTFSKGWSTLCLPFPYAVAEIGQGVKVQSFSNATDNSVSFTEFTGDELAANTPYLVYFPAETSIGTADAPKYLSATIASYNPKAVTFGAFSFAGNYEADMNMDGLYGVATVDGVQKIMRGTASATLPATAAYFTYTGAAQASAFTLNLGGVVSGIDGIEANGTDAATPVYNLQGVRVSGGSLEGLPAGVYVKGGKKVLVK